MKLFLYVSSNRDGILVCPAKGSGKDRRPDGRRRVFLAGDPRLESLTHDQRTALVAVAFRDPDVVDQATAAVFYDANYFARRPERSTREKIIFTHDLRAG